jgi:hypothetical protein
MYEGEEGVREGRRKGGAGGVGAHGRDQMAKGPEHICSGPFAI